jgi:hypothetical protein
MYVNENPNSRSKKKDFDALRYSVESRQTASILQNRPHLQQTEQGERGLHRAASGTRVHLSHTSHFLRVRG